MNKNTENIKKKINIGVEILRIYLSLLVVNTHCYNNSFNKYISKMIRNRLHVPTFFIISFYYFQNVLISRKINKFKNRYQRLIIPYIIWPITFWILNNLIKLKFKFNFDISLKQLKIQLLTGHSFNPVFWFQWNLIFQTFIFIFVELIYHKCLIFILINIGLFSYFLQYSYLNYFLFSQFGNDKRFTFGRFSETIPYSISGFIIANNKIIDRLKKNKIKTVFLFLIAFMLVYNYNIFFIPKGFGYEGIKLHILSLCLFILLSIHSNRFIPQNLIKIILQISKCTPGIYYLHIPIMKYLKIIFLCIKNKNLFGVFIIYIACYSISFFGDIIFRKTKLRNLFQ